MLGLPKEIESLWTLFTAPVVWAAHFVICYVLAAVYCAKQPDLGFDAVRLGIAAATAVALCLIVLAAWLAWRQGQWATQRRSSTTVPPQAAKHCR